MEHLVEVLGWPHFAFLFGIVIVVMFRKELAALISRITSIDRSGVKAGSVPEAQREKKKTDAVQELMLAVGDSVALRDVETIIRTDLAKRGLETDGDSVKVLIKHLGAAQLLLEFEQVHSLIFGSQIFLLKGLNEVAGQGRDKETLVAHFERVRNANKELSEWSFDQYMAFLFARNLVTIQAGRYHITNAGNEYLTWIARSGHSENRPF
jgi:hypothetical protein